MDRNTGSPVDRGTVVNSQLQAVQKSKRDLRRSSRACQNCHKKKIKCTGKLPCHNCARKRLSCVFSEAVKRNTISLAEVESLRRTVAAYQAQQSANSDAVEETQESASDGNSGTNIVAEAQEVPQTHSPAAMEVDEAPHSDHLTRLQVGDHHSIFTEGSTSTSQHERVTPLTGLSSSSNLFGTEIQNVLQAKTIARSQMTAPSTLLADSPFQIDAQTIANIRRWPSEEEAYDLLDIVTLEFGVSQQMFDIRQVSDNISRLYYDTANNVALQGLWFVQVLLILAIGRLLQADAHEDGEVPGSALFNEGKKRLPAIDKVEKEGFLGIEVYGLAAMFLQTADRHAEAYLYSSIALRLCISLGLHKADERVKRTRSRAVHCNRLWWSVYMQEKRLAAAGGYPSAIPDDSVTTALPTDVVCFPPSAPIRVNVQAAQITSLITSSELPLIPNLGIVLKREAIYSQTEKAESTFSQDVEKILRCLYDVESAIPTEYALLLKDSELYVAGCRFTEIDRTHAKTSASLSLLVQQATMLVLRPILLYLARQDRETGTVQDLSPIPKRLAEVCIKAARNSLRILQALRDMELMAKNTFMELDVLFSAGFVFVLIQMIYPDTIRGKPEVEQATKLLEYLVQVGNQAASKRLAHFNAMCTELDVLRERQKSPHDQRLLDELCKDDRTGMVQEIGGSDLPKRPAFGADQDTENSGWNFIASNVEVAASDDAGIANQLCLGDLGFESIATEGQHELYDMYGIADLMYTGAEIVDWASLANCSQFPL